MLRHASASSRQRLGVVAASGCVAGVVSAFFVPWPVAVLAGWDVAALALIAWVWLAVGRFSAAQTRQLATREDDSRVAFSLFLLTACVASLAGAGIAIASAGQHDGAERTALLVVGALTVFLSWGVVQTEFALRYAHEYYSEPEGGIDFGDGTGDPDYQDFAYVSFTIGMTFQISDTGVQDRRIRRTVLRHALLAYLFGAVILAVMVNVIGGIVG